MWLISAILYLVSAVSLVAIVFGFFTDPTWSIIGLALLLASGLCQACAYGFSKTVVTE